MRFQRGGLGSSESTPTKYQPSTLWRAMTWQAPWGIWTRNLRSSWRQTKKKKSSYSILESQSRHWWKGGCIQTRANSFASHRLVQALRKTKTIKMYLSLALNASYPTPGSTMKKVSKDQTEIHPKVVQLWSSKLMKLIKRADFLARLMLWHQSAQARTATSHWTCQMGTKKTRLSANQTCQLADNSDDETRSPSKKLCTEQACKVEETRLISSIPATTSTCNDSNPLTFAKSLSFHFPLSTNTAFGVLGFWGLQVSQRAVCWNKSSDWWTAN